MPHIVQKLNGNVKDKMSLMNHFVIIWGEFRIQNSEVRIQKKKIGFDGKG